LGLVGLALLAATGACDGNGGGGSPDSGVPVMGPEEGGADLGVPPVAPPPPGCPTPGPTTADSTTPGAITTPNPTLRNLSLEWAISGDANHDGVVTVRFRVAGSSTWRAGMPLRRVPAGSYDTFSWSNRHSGSLFDLEPDTAYEIELALRDPDGGCDTRTVMARTRPVPAPMAGAPVRAVTPANFSSIANSAQPGDILELGAGTYAGFTFTRDGATGRPIVLRSTAGAVINGNVELSDRSHVYLIGLTINGRVRLNGGTDLAFIKNTVNTQSDGFVAYTRAEDCYFGDNVVTGSTQWSTGALGVNGANTGEGIVVTGPGHVIEHNRVSGFRDCISLMEDVEAVDQWSEDIVENDASICADDGVESDFCFHNCRTMRNRFTNVFMAMSSQPSLGGPTYFIRNAAYNVILSAFKLQRSSVGDVVLHNTIVKNGDALGIYTDEPIERALFRNNLLVGGPGGSYNGYSNGTGRVMDLVPVQPSCDLDYDAVGSTTGMFAGKLGTVRFSDLAGLKAMTTEKHARAVDLTVFAATVAYPSSPFPALPIADLRPKAGSAVVDGAEAIPNVSDVFAGSAPDVGAYEVGAALPQYGPR